MKNIYEAMLNAPFAEESVLAGILKENPIVVKSHRHAIELAEDRVRHIEFAVRALVAVHQEGEATTAKRYFQLSATDMETLSRFMALGAKLDNVAAGRPTGKAAGVARSIHAAANDVLTADDEEEEDREGGDDDNDEEE
jgi:hypothetical protein